MVQTRAGAQNSEWLQFMRECAVAYRKRKESVCETRKEPAVKPPCARRRRKQTVEETSSSKVSVDPHTNLDYKSS